MGRVSPSRRSVAEKPSLLPLAVIRAAPHVGGEHHDGVFEIRLAALGVGHHPVLHDLEQDAPDVRVGLFDLVKEHHAIGPPPHLFGELAPLLVAHIARR